MILTINETNQCWICGKDIKESEKEKHHAIPKHLKPIHNILIPVCSGCHKRLNKEDINGMYSYLFKIKNIIKENVGMVNISLKNLDGLRKIKEEQLELKKRTNNFLE